jgi:hypothetical protein
MIGVRRAVTCCAVILVCCLAGCSQRNSAQIDYQMGDKATLGPLVYNVIDTNWKPQLGDPFQLRLPQQRFLLIKLSVTNGGGSELSIPLLTLENSAGQTFEELSDGQGVDNWFGLLRDISPAQTLQGQLLFDVPLGDYRLRITDGAGPGAEKYAWISIPLRMDVNTALPAPVPGSPIQ